MPDNFDFTDYASQVRKTARTLFGAVHSSADIAASMHLLTVAVERDLSRFGEPPAQSRVACGPGCGSCCVVNVDILFPEATAIVRFLKKRFSAKMLERVSVRLGELLQRTRWLDDEERIFLREPCAFLDHQGRCLIHVVRPLLCRAVTSTDPDRCRDAIVMAPLDGTLSVEMNLFQKNLLETVYRELGETLGDLGLDGRSRRLSCAVRDFWAEPESADRFLAGEMIS